MEKRFDKESYRDVVDFRACKSKRKLGWRLLMMGIAVEIVLGFGHALKDAQEIRQIKISQANNDPLNRPIKSITADVFLEIRGTNFLHVNGTNVIDWMQSGMGLQRPETMADFTVVATNGTLARLQCNKFVSLRIQSNDGKETVGRMYSMGFSWPALDWAFVSINIEDWVSRNGISTKQLDSKMAGAAIGVFGAMKGMKVVSGKIVFTINGSIQRPFSIPQYTDDLMIYCAVSNVRPN